MVTPLDKFLDSSRPLDIIKAFLHYAWEPIDYSYDGLTTQEQRLCTREEFHFLVQWLLDDRR